MTHQTARDEELSHVTGLLRTSLEILDKIGASVAALHVATALEALMQGCPTVALRQRTEDRQPRDR
jgi:hypothetical protein